MNILKQSTAATIKLGPFVDDTDGKTAETALTIGQADIRLSKNGGDIAQTNNATGATHDELGYYDIPLDTTDTGTLGRLRVLVSKAGALPVWQDFLIVTANVFDTFCSTGSLNVNAASLSTDAITAAAVKADAVTKIQNGLATPTNITAGTITTVTNLTNLPTMPTDWLTAAGLKADAVTEIQSGLATAAALDAVDNFIDTEVAAILAAVDTEVAAIKAKTDNLPASPAAVGSAMTLTAAYDKAKDDVLTPLAVVDSIVDGLKTTLDNIHDTDLPAVKTETATIKAKTDNLPVAPASAGEYTINIGAIKAKTDNLPATPAASGEYTSALSAIQSDLDNPNQYKADVSGLATSAELAQTEADIIAAMPDETVIPDGIALETSVQAIKAKTDNLPATPASAGEYAAAIAAIPTTPLLAANYTAPDNASIATIKAKTNLIPANPAVADEYDAALAAIQADLDNPNQYKADVSALMLASSYVAPNNAGITAIKAKTDNLPANTATALAAIQSDLDNPAQYKADVSALATQASVNAIPTTPLLAANYTAPDNAAIGEIKAKTDQLTFTVPNKVDASATVDPTGIATSEELDIIGEKVDGVLNKLNVSSVEFVTAVVGSNITILRGDTLAARLLDLGDLTQYANLDFTVKRVAGELDDAAKIRLRKNASGTDDGLLRINGAEYATATDGSIVIDDLTTGDIEIKLNAAATRELVPGNYVYDVQLIIANEVRTLTAGKLEVVADVTRAVA